MAIVLCGEVQNQRKETSCAIRMVMAGIWIVLVFESWLRALALERGAELLSPATLDGLQRSDEKWLVRSRRMRIRLR